MLALTWAALMLPAATYAQTKDADGWGPVKWGMTVEEARTAVGPGAKDSTDIPGSSFTFIDRLIVLDVKIGDQEMRASLQTPRGSDQIRRVSLSLKADMQSPSSVRRDAFGDLRALVIAKYGGPGNEDKTADRNEVIRTLLWSLPSTTITLIWKESAKYEVGYVALIYTAVDKKALDVL